MRISSPIVVGLVVAISLMSCFICVIPLTLWSMGVQSPFTSGVRSQPLPPIVRVQAMADLATTKIQIADNIVGSNNNYEVTWILHGEGILGVDLSKAQYASIDEAGRTAILVLPDPHLISSKVDHERSNETTVKWKRYVPGLPGYDSLKSEVWKHADKKIAQLASHDGYRERAKVQAEKVLNDLFAGPGWKVTYQWCPAEE